jgi:large subunit ribosomal protein L24
MKLRKNDTIVVNIGKDKGRTGKIEKVFPKLGEVLVAGINMAKRHTKRRDDKNPGGIIDITKPISSSKVALICPSCKKPTRIGFLVAKNEKVRICRKCGKKI